MNPVFRGIAIYVFLLIIFRFTGKRSLAETSTFDFILLLIISEATQQGMLGDDFSLTNAFLLIGTLIGMDIFFNKIKQASPLFDKAAESVPLLLVSEGVVLEDRLKRMDMDIDDIMEVARTQFGIHLLKNIRYAVLERSGSISIVRMTEPHEK